MTIEEFIESCIFGFILLEGGWWKACIKCTIGPWYNRRVITCMNWVKFNEVLYEWTECKLNVHGNIYFNNIGYSDCNKFAIHYIQNVSEEDVKKYEGYNIGNKFTIESYKTNFYSPSKTFSADEFKAFIIAECNTFIKDHANYIKNKELYKRKGSVFRSCK
jgi:hypothetical protein